MARTPTGSKRKKFQAKEKKRKTEVSARHKRTAKTGGITKPTKVVKTQRTPEQLAKLSPAQLLFVEKDIISSSEEGALRQLQGFVDRKEAQRPVLGPENAPEGFQTQRPIQGPEERPEGFQAQPTVDPTALNQNLINQDLVAQQVQGAVPVPENFVKDVAIATAIGATAIATGTVAITTAAIIPAITADGVSLIATRGITAPAVANAARGKLTSSVIKETIKIGGGKVRINTYNAGKITSWIGRLAASFKNPAFVAGAIGSYIFSVGFSFNEGQGDVATTLKIAHRDALQKNPELAKEIAKQMNDVWSMSNILKNFIPIGNFFLADWRKVKATNKIVQAEQEASEVGTFELSPQQIAEGERFIKKDSEKGTTKKAFIKIQRLK